MPYHAVLYRTNCFVPHILLKTDQTFQSNVYVCQNHLCLRKTRKWCSISKVFNCFQENVTTNSMFENVCDRLENKFIEFLALWTYRIIYCTHKTQTYLNTHTFVNTHRHIDTSGYSHITGLCCYVKIRESETQTRQILMLTRG